MYTRKELNSLSSNLTYIAPPLYCQVLLLLPVLFIYFPKNINSSSTILPKKSYPPSIMNLKLSALIIFTSTLISLSTSFPQEPKDDQLEEARAKLHELAVRPAPNLDVIPVNFSDPNPHKKRDVSRLPTVMLYICAEPLLKGRCEKLASKRGFCCKYNFLSSLLNLQHT